MNEKGFPDEQQEARNDARATAIQAAQKLWDSYAVSDDDYAGTIVTGYVLVAEAVLPSGFTSIAWCGGNGQPPDSEGITGLPSHRIDGMLRYVIQEAYQDMAAEE